VVLLRAVKVLDMTRINSGVVSRLDQLLQQVKARPSWAILNYAANPAAQKAEGR
jgi:hypothetical protein